MEINRTSEIRMIRDGLKRKYSAVGHELSDLLATAKNLPSDEHSRLKELVRLSDSLVAGEDFNTVRFNILSSSLARDIGYDYSSVLGMLYMVVTTLAVVVFIGSVDSGYVTEFESQHWILSGFGFLFLLVLPLALLMTLAVGLFKIKSTKCAINDALLAYNQKQKRKSAAGDNDSTIYTSAHSISSDGACD